jgi:hypothetical protein
MIQDFTRFKHQKYARSITGFAPPLRIYNLPVLCVLLCEKFNCLNFISERNYWGIVGPLKKEISQNSKKTCFPVIFSPPAAVSAGRTNSADQHKINTIFLITAFCRKSYCKKTA